MASNLNMSHASNMSMTKPGTSLNKTKAGMSAVPMGNEPEELSDKAFNEYNKSLLLGAMNVLLERHQAEFAKSADNQLAILKNAVEQSVCTRDNLDHQIHVSKLLDDLEEDLEISEQAINETVGDPVFLDSKNFEDVTAELNEVSNQLPCKNVQIPRTKKDFDDIDNAGASLSDKLGAVSLKHGDEIHLVSRIKEKVSELDSVCNSLSEANASIKELMPIATTKVLDATSKNMMNSTLANMDIKF